MWLRPRDSAPGGSFTRDKLLWNTQGCCAYYQFPSGPSSGGRSLRGRLPFVIGKPLHVVCKALLVSALPIPVLPSGLLRTSTFPDPMPCSAPALAHPSGLLLWKGRSPTVRLPILASDIPLTLANVHLTSILLANMKALGRQGSCPACCPQYLPCRVGYLAWSRGTGSLWHEWVISASSFESLEWEGVP